jgi:hypothetical protein
MARPDEDLLKVLDATYTADPHHQDENIELIQDTVRWCLGHDDSTAEEFIHEYIEDL